MNTVNYLRAYGLEHREGDLLYKRLPGGNYILFWQSSNDIDVFLCRWLPDSHKQLDESCIIDEILSFDSTKDEKVAKFKLMLEQRNERNP